jgi:hypothetical protein
MKIKEVSYGRTYNLGNFENLSLELKASLDDTDSAELVAKRLALELDHIMKESKK